MEQLSSFLTTNWNDLPNEIKVMIIEMLENNTRLALRACSSQDLQIVDSVPFRTIHKLQLENKEDIKIIKITKSSYSSEILFEFSSFEEFQNKLTGIMENVSYIEWMSVIETDSENRLKLAKNGKLARVGELFFYATCIDPASVIEQVEPVQLKKIELQKNDFDPRIFNMPQVINAKVIVGSSNTINDNQLLELKCSELRLWLSTRLTSFGLKKFIKKCLLNLDEKPVSFRIYFDPINVQTRDVFEGLNVAESVDALQFDPATIISNSPSSSFKLEIEYDYDFIFGRTLWNSNFESENALAEKINIVESITIEINENQKSFAIKTKNSAEVFYEFHSTDEFQSELTKEINRIDGIQKLIISNRIDSLDLQSSIKKILRVRKLSIDGGNIIDVLRLIDPVYLEELSICRTIESADFYDLPHVIHAKKLILSNCLIRDYQLLKLDAVWIGFHTSDFEYQTNLTEFGINQFLKKRVYTLNESEFHLEISSLAFKNHTQSSELLEGLDILSKKQDDDEDDRCWLAIANSPFPEFQLELSLRRNRYAERIMNFKAERVEKPI